MHVACQLKGDDGLGADEQASLQYGNDADIYCGLHGLVISLEPEMELSVKQIEGLIFSVCFYTIAAFAVNFAMYSFGQNYTYDCVLYDCV